MAVLLRPSSFLLGALRRPPTQLLGREVEAALIEEHLREPGVSLVTLTGPGGVGKTHLALDVASRLEPLFADGIAVVDLAQVRDPADVPAAIAAAIGLREPSGRSPREAMFAAVRDYHLLLVLDNFEHLLSAAPLVADILAAAPDLKAIATSRERLALRGEHVLHVPPLAVPSPHSDGEMEVEDLLTYPAVALFVDRARSVDPGFRLTTATASSVAEVCARLDGLPLAIELAAARIRLMPLAAMLAHGESLLSFLDHGPRDAPPRHQTLLATIAWSYDLLTADEQTTLRQLALFRGGFSLAAAVDVARLPKGMAPPRETVANILTSLVEKNLLLTVSDSINPATPRFAHLETIREFALERLTSHGEFEATRRRLISHVLTLASSSAAERFTNRPVAATDSLWPDRENVRQVMTWLLDESDPEPALRLGGTLWQWWFEWGDLGGARNLLIRAVARPGATEFPDLWAAVTGAIGALSQALGDHVSAAECSTSALAVARASGDTRLAAAALNTLGLDAMVRGDYNLAASLLEEGQALFATAGDPRAGWWCARHRASVAHRRGQMPLTAQLASEGLEILNRGGHQADSGGLLHTLGLALAFQGNLPGAVATWERCLHVFQERGDDWGVANALGGLGFAAYEQEDYPRASARLEGSLALYRRIGDTEGQVFRLCHLGWTFRAQGDTAESEHRFMEALDLSRSRGHDQCLAAVLVGLGALALNHGERAAAARHWDESLRVARQIGDHVGIATAFEWIAHLGLGSGERSAAAHLMRAAKTLRLEFGFPQLPSDRNAHEPVMAELSTALGQETRVASAASSPMSLEAALANASVVLSSARAMVPKLASQPIVSNRALASGSASLLRLTRQERRVLSLIAEGKTDAAIAVELFISRPTVSKHVGAVLHKLGVPSRSAAAVAAVRHGLI